MYQKCYGISVSGLDYSNIYQKNHSKSESNSNILDFSPASSKDASAAEPRQSCRILWGYTAAPSLPSASLGNFSSPKKGPRKVEHPPSWWQGKFLQASPRHPTSSKEELKEPWRNFKYTLCLYINIDTYVYIYTYNMYINNHIYIYHHIYLYHIKGKENMYHMPYTVLCHRMSYITFNRFHIIF